MTLSICTSVLPARKLIVPILLLCVWTMSPYRVHAGTAAEGFAEATRKMYDMKEAAFAANDYGPILSEFYDEAVISTGPDGVTHEGVDELRPVYQEVIGADVKITSYRSFVKGEAGWDWVNFHVTPPAESGEAPFTFKMLFLWEKKDGHWRSHGEMYVPGKFAEGKH